MMRTTVNVAMLTLATIALSGCSTLFGKRFMAKADRPETQQARAGATYSLDLGRQHLDAGRTGLAIEAFQTALVTGEAAAPAFNGLGVAFARLGRFDLAERYFQRAAAIDPATERYALNLSRLMRSQDYAMRGEGDRLAEVQRAIVSDAAMPRAAEMTESHLKGRIQQVGKGQVFIQSSGAQAAPVRTAIVQVDPRFRPLIRDELAPLPEDSDPGRTDDEPNAEKPRIVNFKPVVRDALPPIRN